jgi:hypothetical protein
VSWDPGWIDRMIERVEDLLKDRPELDNLLAGRPRINYRHRTHDELLGDVNQLYDKLVSLTKERDELRKSLNEAKEKLESLKYINLKFWICSIAVVAQCGVIAFLAKELFARIPH